MTSEPKAWIAPAPGELFRHYGNGHIYEVIGSDVDSDNSNAIDKIRVRYRLHSPTASDRQMVFSRNIGEWYAEVGGVRRFQPIDRFDSKTARRVATEQIRPLAEKLESHMREVHTRLTSSNRADALDAQFTKDAPSFTLLIRTQPMLRAFDEERRYRDELTSMMRTMLLALETQDLSKHDRLMYAQALELLARAP